MEWSIENCGVKDFKDLCDVDFGNMIQSAATNEGYINASKIRFLDGEIKSLYFEYGEVGPTKCVVKLKNVVTRSPDVGVEELGDVNLIDNLDGEGFKYAF